MPVIVLQYEDDVNFPTGLFLEIPEMWTAKHSNTSHHLQNYIPALQLSQLYSGAL